MTGPSERTELTRRLCGGSIWSGHRYALEDATGRAYGYYKRKQFSFSGTIQTGSSEYDYRTRRHLSRSEIQVRLRGSASLVAVATVGGRPRTITIGNKAVPYTVNWTSVRGIWLILKREARATFRARRALITVHDQEGQRTYAAWFDKYKIRTRPSFPVGHATVEGCAVDDEAVLVILLAFDVLARLLRGTVGGG